MHLNHDVVVDKHVYWALIFITDTPQGHVGLLKAAFKAGLAQGFHYFWPTVRVLMCFPLTKLGKVFRNGI